MDEQWSFVGVLCHVFGRRTKSTLNRLLKLLGNASICYFMTDG
jgi:IS1 family transposase